MHRKVLEAQNTPFLLSQLRDSVTDGVRHNYFYRILEYTDRLHHEKTVLAKILRTSNPATCSNQSVQFPQPSHKNHCISKRYEH